MAKIRLLLADDHALVRASFKSFLNDFPDFEVVAEAGDGRQALKLVATHSPAVVLMDIAMPSLNGLEATRRIVKEHPDTRVIILSMHAGEEHVMQALDAGASGYVLKGAAPLELELAIISVARGERFLSPAISKQVIDVYLGGAAKLSRSLEQLTSRQRDVLHLGAEGKSSKEMALLLGASVKTSERHRA